MGVDLERIERRTATPGAGDGLRRTAAAAAVSAAGYGALRLYWAIAGAPDFGPLDTDLMGVTGWSAVALCAAAAAVTAALLVPAWHRALLGAAFVVAAVLASACGLLLLDVVALLIPGLGLPFDLGAFLSRAACLGVAFLAAAAAVRYRRLWVGDCAACGRGGLPAATGDVAPRPVPAWARAGAYVAIAGCLVRLGAQSAVGPGGGPLDPGAAMRVFEAGFLLAGVVLPLALVQGFGRVFPRWVPLVAGRRVPRRLLSVPAFSISGGLLVYFGIGIAQLVHETVTGTWDADGLLPLWFFWVAMPAYWVWGAGLAAAAVGHHLVTRPPCRACGRR